MSRDLSRSGLIVAFVLGLSWAVTGIAEDPKDAKSEDKPAAAKTEDKPADPAKPADAPPPVKRTQAELEAEFEKTMSGCVLVGKFTVVGREDMAPKEERYTITKVKKQDDGDWIIVSRIQYGNHDVSVPIKLQVEWAGDTPVISLTDLTIPGMGTFTSRVLIYRGWYSGTWLHGKVGGHLFGKIEKLPDEKKDSKKKSDPSVTPEPEPKK